MALTLSSLRLFVAQAVVYVAQRWGRGRGARLVFSVVHGCQQDHDASKSVFANAVSGKKQERRRTVKGRQRQVSEVLVGAVGL